MYYMSKPNPHPYAANNPMYNTDNMYSHHYLNTPPIYGQDFFKQYPNQTLPFDHTGTYGCFEPIDYGPAPFVIDIEEATKKNTYFRTTSWTGCHMQLTLMSINVGEDIGLEIHPDHDQFIRIEEGQGLIRMGNRQDQLDYEANVFDDIAIIIPAGKWHNLFNTGCKPLKLYSIYAPPEHPRGTIHQTKAIAEAEENHGY